jgi:hypothetical protein
MLWLYVSFPGECWKGTGSRKWAMLTAAQGLRQAYHDARQPIAGVLRGGQVSLWLPALASRIGEGMADAVLAIATGAAEGIAAAAEHRPDAGQLDPCLPDGGYVKIILAELDAQGRLQASAMASDPQYRSVA